jgi:hypothetical protein
MAVIEASMIAAIKDRPPARIDKVLRIGGIVCRIFPAACG